MAEEVKMLDEVKGQKEEFIRNYFSNMSIAVNKYKHNRDIILEIGTAREKIIHLFKKAFNPSFITDIRLNQDQVMNIKAEFKRADSSGLPYDIYTINIILLSALLINISEWPVGFSDILLTVYDFVNRQYVSPQDLQKSYPKQLMAQISNLLIRSGKKVEPIVLNDEEYGLIYPVFPQTISNPSDFFNAFSSYLYPRNEDLCAKLIISIIDKLVSPDFINTIRQPSEFNDIFSWLERIDLQEKFLNAMEAKFKSENFITNTNEFIEIFNRISGYSKGKASLALINDLYFRTSLFFSIYEASLAAQKEYDDFQAKFLNDMEQKMPPEHFVRFQTMLFNAMENKILSENFIHDPIQFAEMLKCLSINKVLQNRFINSMKNKLMSPDFINKVNTVEIFANIFPLLSGHNELQTDFFNALENKILSTQSIVLAYDLAKALKCLSVNEILQNRFIDSMKDKLISPDFIKTVSSDQFIDIFTCLSKRVDIQESFFNAMRSNFEYRFCASDAIKIHQFLSGNEKLQNKFIEFIQDNLTSENFIRTIDNDEMFIYIFNALSKHKELQNSFFNGMKNQFKSQVFMCKFYANSVDQLHSYNHFLNIFKCLGGDNELLTGFFNAIENIFKAPDFTIRPDEYIEAHRSLSINPALQNRFIDLTKDKLLSPYFIDRVRAEGFMEVFKILSGHAELQNKFIDAMSHKLLSESFISSHSSFTKIFECLSGNSDLQISLIEAKKKITLDFISKVWTENEQPQQKQVAPEVIGYYEPLSFLSYIKYEPSCIVQLKKQLKEDLLNFNCLQPMMCGRVSAGSDSPTRMAYDIKKLCDNIEENISDILRMLLLNIHKILTNPQYSGISKTLKNFLEACVNNVNAEQNVNNEAKGASCFP